VQIDELDLAWEDESDRGRHTRKAQKQRAKGGKKKGGRGGKTILALLLSLCVLGGLVFGGWYGIDKVKGFFSAPDYDTGGSGDVQVEVLDNQTATDIGLTLQKADVVKSSKAFVEAAKADARSKGLQPGFYKLRKKMRAADALSLMLNPDSKVTSKVTLPEGLTFQEAYKKLSDATKIPVADFEKAGADPTKLGLSPDWFKRTDGKQPKISMEGFLYPATYSFNPGVTATDVLKAIVTKFNNEMTKIDFMALAQSKLNISPFEVLIAASIAQVEGIFPEDQAKIARVLYNRAYTNKFKGKEAGCACLQLDSTVNYYLKISGAGAKPSQDLLRSELHNKNDPYNTYDIGGFPIGPISSPGNTAIEGALNPPTTSPDVDMLYFVAIDKAGHTAFAKNKTDHDKNIQTAKKNGAL
jgi:UPF0755 protein